MLLAIFWWLGSGAIGVCALISTYGYLSANLLHSTRITFALAEQGDFPQLFARIHPRFRTPHISILAYALAVVGFAAAGDFRWNAILSAATRLVVYGQWPPRLLVLRKRRGPAPFSLPLGPLFAAASLLIVLILLSRIGAGEALVLALTAAMALANWSLRPSRRRRRKQTLHSFGQIGSRFRFPSRTNLRTGWHRTCANTAWREALQ
jgi:amino acid transporter